MLGKEDKVVWHLEQKSAVYRHIDLYVHGTVVTHYLPISYRKYTLCSNRFFCVGFGQCHGFEIQILNPYGHFWYLYSMFEQN